MNLPILLQTILDGQDLSATEMEGMMHLIMDGQATPAQVAGILIALRMKGETVEEITAAAKVMRELCARVDVTHDQLVDTCGTGGDHAQTFNISTAAAFVVAAAGGRVAKHGNRSVSSKSGSVDVLEAAGANLALTPVQVARCIEQVGIGFLFAPNHHSAMKHVIGARRELGVRTIFNVLGPLTNPTRAPHQVIGVFSEKWLQPMAETLKNLGSKHVLVVHARDGLDEISIQNETLVCELKANQIKRYSIHPKQFGLTSSSLDTLRATSVQQSLKIINEVLSNVSGPALDIVKLNAGAALYACGVAASVAEGVNLAGKTLAQGLAKEKFEAFTAFTNQFK